MRTELVSLVSWVSRSHPGYLGIADGRSGIWWLGMGYRNLSIAADTEPALCTVFLQATYLLSPFLAVSELGQGNSHSCSHHRDKTRALEVIRLV